VSSRHRGGFRHVDGQRPQRSAMFRLHFGPLAGLTRIATRGERLFCSYEGGPLL
jgi:hypothetical protein